MKTKYSNVIAGGILLVIGFTLVISMFECADWYVKNIQNDFLIGAIIFVALISFCIGVILLAEELY